MIGPGLGGKAKTRGVCGCCAPHNAPEGPFERISPRPDATTIPSNDYYNKLPRGDLSYKKGNHEAGRDNGVPKA